MLDDAVHAILSAYPTIHSACRRRDLRDPASGKRLSDHQAGILEHLDVETPITVSELAARLRVTSATASLQLTQLARLRLVTRDRDEADARRVQVRLTDGGRPDAGPPVAARPRAGPPGAGAAQRFRTGRGRGRPPPAGRRLGRSVRRERHLTPFTPITQENLPTMNWTRPAKTEDPEAAGQDRGGCPRHRDRHPLCRRDVPARRAHQDQPSNPGPASRDGVAGADRCGRHAALAVGCHRGGASPRPHGQAGLAGSRPEWSAGGGAVLCRAAPAPGDSGRRGWRAEPADAHLPAGVERRGDRGHRD